MSPHLSPKPPQGDNSKGRLFGGGGIPHLPFWSINRDGGGTVRGRSALLGSKGFLSKIGQFFPHRKKIRGQVQLGGHKGWWAWFVPSCFHRLHPRWQIFLKSILLKYIMESLVKALGKISSLPTFFGRQCPM